MIPFDKKEENYISVYREKFEKRDFDEIDIGFFAIFIRSHIEPCEKGQYSYIWDLCNFIAHRSREKGDTFDSISNARKNYYATKKGSKEIQGYNGAKPEKWEAQWRKLGAELDINFSKEAIRDITICVMSLYQFSCYYNSEDAFSATMELMQGANELSLCTVANEPHAPYVVYMKADDLTFEKTYSSLIIEDAVFAVRESGNIRLKKALLH